MRPTARHLAAALAVALLLSACGFGSATDDGRIDHPTGDELVLRVEYHGGFQMPGADLYSLPSFTLLGDGRVITTGAVPAIFPGPALPPIQVRRLTEEGLQAVLREVARTGQFAASAEWRGAAGFVADANDTIFTLRAEGREVRVVVYALGYLPEPAPGQPNGMPGLSEAEVAAHRALSALEGWLVTLETELAASAWADPASRPFESEALRLVVTNADGEAPDPAIPFEEVPWPVESDPAEFGDPTTVEGLVCGVVTGDEVRAWYAALAQATQVTRFVGGGHRFQVMPRPILPDEEPACPERADGV
ncbi:MAG TPA: hypothetical protein VFH63_10550 [candidate division Zixibacteria bacterium]|nr:hypothetical protein [candidate division Zixibacteria bacterium]